MMMRSQIVSDAQGVWAVVFYRSPFEYPSVLSLAEYAEIDAFLVENDLVQDEQKPDVISHESVRVRVKLQTNEETTT